MEYHRVTKLAEEKFRKVSNEGQGHYWASLESEASKIREVILLRSIWDSIQSILCSFGIPNTRKILINWASQVQAHNMQRKVGNMGLFRGK